MAKHIVVTRFSIPMECPSDPEAIHRHKDREWLDGRVELFYKYFLPALEPVKDRVRLVLLCSPETIDYVRQAIDIPGIGLTGYPEWAAGHLRDDESYVTRLDSDDALDPTWFDDIEQVDLQQYNAMGTLTIFQYCSQTNQAYRITLGHPSPLVAVPHGQNVNQYNHTKLHDYYTLCLLEKPYLVQVVHGGNLLNKIFKSSVPVPMESLPKNFRAVLN